MKKQAVTKYVRISAFKVREVTRLIQGKPVVEALALVEFSPRKAARLVGDTLRSAVANAENAPASRVVREALTVTEAVAGEGPTMKRMRAMGRGHSGRICKRTSHIRVVVSDER